MISFFELSGKNRQLSASAQIIFDLSFSKPQKQPNFAANLKKMTTLYLTRHGETVENVQHILQGHLPGTLTAKGIEQAQTLRDKLQGEKFDAIVVSDLKRTVDTARIVAEPHQQELILTPLLRERDWGSLTGAYIPDVRDKQFPANTETVEALFLRAHLFLEYIITEFPNKKVLAIGHGLFNRTILAALEGKTIREITPFSNAEVRIVSLTPEMLTSGNQQEDTKADN